MVQPSIRILQNILDKKLFADAAIRAGLSVLPSWHPRSVDDVAALAPTLPYPVLIKPRTHVHRRRNDKGIVVHSANDLVGQYRQFLDRERRTVDDPLLPDANLPILQQFIRVGGEGVHSVTGYIDQTGQFFVTRAATKVFQRSQPVGVGVCFESRPPCSKLSEAVRRLCRELGYFGIFEVEFLWFNKGWAAIDFNPRLFSQIGMDIRRGMPLPLFACLDVAGDFEGLRQAISSAQVEPDQQIVFFDRFTLRAILLAQSLTARISRQDIVYWRDWIRRHTGSAIDFSADATDPIPGFVHVLSEIYLGCKSIPRFLRSRSRTAVQPSQLLSKEQP